jgi:hypothetical protein
VIARYSFEAGAAGDDLAVIVQLQLSQGTALVRAIISAHWASRRNSPAALSRSDTNASLSFRCHIDPALREQLAARQRHQAILRVFHKAAILPIHPLVLGQPDRWVAGG